MTDEHVHEYQTLKGLNKNADRALLQQRGRDFEKLINNIFESEKILLRGSFHTEDDRSEQIDGAIEVLNRIFLLEAKWQESSDLAASDLYAFIGKVENKFVGTAGIFISRPELSHNFINALNKGRRQSVIVIHGPDIDEIFKHKVSLRDYLEQTIRIISYDNKIHHPVSAFLESQRPLAKVPDTTDVSVAANNFLVEKIAKNGLTEGDLTNLRQSATEMNDIVFSYIVNRFESIRALALKNSDYSIETRAKSFLENYKPSRAALIRTAENYFSKLALQNPQLYYLDEFRNLFGKEIYDAMNQETKTAFEDGILKIYRQYRGQFQKENVLSILIEPLWTSLTQQTRDRLAWFYLDIYIDSVRSSAFFQKQYAIELVDKGEIGADTIEQWSDDKFKRGLDSYDGIVTDAERLIASAYLPIAGLLHIPTDQWEMYVHQRLVTLQKGERGDA